MPSTDFPQGTAFFPNPGGGAGADDLWWLDVFTIPSDTTTPTTYALYAYPHNLSPTVALNGVTLRENDDYNIDYANAVLTVYDDLTAGDNLTVRYEYTTVVGSGALIPLTTPVSDADLVGQIGSGGGLDLTFTPSSLSACFVIFGYASSDLRNDVLTFTETWGYTWQKLAEVNLQNGTNPDTIHLVVFATRTGASAPPGTFSIPNAPANQFFVARAISFTHAVPSLNVGTDKGINVASLDATLATVPGASDGVLGMLWNWPHTVVTPDAAYTLLTEENSGSGGPYSIPARLTTAYNITSPTQDATFDNASGTDSILVLCGVSPTST